MADHRPIRPRARPRALPSTSSDGRSGLATPQPEEPGWVLGIIAAG
jgi:hypothetical protein